MSHWLDKVLEIFTADTDDLVELARIAGASNLRQFYSGVDPSNVDAGMETKRIVFGVEWKLNPGGDFDGAMSYERGVQSYNEGLHKAAIEYLSEAFRLGYQKELDNLIKKLADSYYKTGRFMDSGKWWEIYAEKFPSDATGWRWLAMCWIKMRRHAVAEQLLRGIHDRDVFSVNTYEILANLLIRRKDIKGAIQVLLEAAERFSRKERFWLWAARLSEQTSDEIDTLNIYMRASDSLPDSINVVMHYSKYLLRMGRGVIALNICEEKIDLCRKHSRSIIWLSELYSEFYSPEHAFLFIADALKSKPTDLLVLKQYLDYMEIVVGLDDVIVTIEDFIKKYPSQKMAYKWLSDAMMKVGRENDAVNVLEDLIMRNQADLAIRKWLVELLTRIDGEAALAAAMQATLAFGELNLKTVNKWLTIVKK